ncbi:MAG: endonuclease [Firmicutes bacterium HGW-Firmicutes-14]|jgi:endonuclease-3 related protein|nr:MAG: endonuclease [Firmicutes bacterium HGW-Firmicutes-14]
MTVNNAEQIKTRLMEIYKKMFEHFGPRGWWPGDTDFEICVGAILTQSVSWKNVMKAINSLKASGLLDVSRMYSCSNETLEKHIIPTMYYRMKAKKLKAFAGNIVEKYNGNLRQMLSRPLEELREELLSIYGIGPETADSIILYAAGKPVFVVDAYTRRIFSRLGIFREDVAYDEMQRYFMRHLPHDVQLFNEFHALIAGTGNKYCGNKKPKCSRCPVLQECGFTR